MARVNKEAIRRSAHLHFPEFLRSRSNAVMLDAWMEGRQYDAEDHEGNEIGKPYIPPAASTEYPDLAKRSTVPWAGLIVTSLAQTAYVDGIRAPKSNENMQAWETMERNSWSRRQIAIHRAAIGHGASYGVVLPGTDPLTGDKMALMRGKSSKRMAAFYDDEDDEWCLFALEGIYQPALQSSDESGWYIRFYDETAVHYLWARGEGLDLADWEYISYEPHPFRVPPVARCVNRIDTEGNTIGEIAPVIPLLQSIDQDKFDRLIVQRFGAWKVRYIAGMARPTDQQQAAYQAMKLKIEDLLISTNKDTKFGTLDATDLKGFIEAHDADLRVLSAITQTPPHHLLGRLRAERSEDVPPASGLGVGGQLNGHPHRRIGDQLVAEKLECQATHRILLTTLQRQLQFDQAVDQAPLGGFEARPLFELARQLQVGQHLGQTTRHTQRLLIVGRHGPVAHLMLRVVGTETVTTALGSRRQ